jgi:hypothetical protein
MHQQTNNSSQPHPTEIIPKHKAMFLPVQDNEKFLVVKRVGDRIRFAGLTEYLKNIGQGIGKVGFFWQKKPDK